MTTKTTELARETAHKMFPFKSNTRDFAQGIIQSALDQQAKAYAEALKVATDAFEGLRNNQNCRNCAGIVATNALARIAELLPK